MSEAPSVYSPSEVAAILGLHPNTVWRWLASGKLPGRKVGGIWLVSAERLAAWMANEPLPATRSHHHADTAMIRRYRG